MSDPERRCLFSDPDLALILRILGGLFVAGCLVLLYLAWRFIP